MSGNEDNQRDNLGRRTILQSVGAVGLTSTIGIGTVAADSGSESELSDEVIGIAELRSTTGAILGNEEIATIGDELINRGYRPRINDVVGIPVPTDDVRTVIPDDYPEFDPAAFEETDPVTVFLPYVNNSGDVALMIVLVASETDSNARTNTPVAAMGLVESNARTSDSDDVVASASSDAIDVIGFAEADTAPREATVVDTWAGSDISPQYEGFGCLALVLELCRRWGTSATVTQCGNVCVRTAQPWFVAGCGSFCVGLVLIIQRYGCNETGAVICAAASVG